MEGGSFVDRELLLRAYGAIGARTPLTSDCGALCGAACCAPDADGQGGVALLSIEAEALAGADWAKLGRDAHMDAPMLICKGPCARALRPFLCRVFPLCPIVGRDGKWTVRIDARSRAACPLSRGGLRGLDPEFVRGAVRAARILAQDAEGEAFLRRWAEIEAEFRKPLF